MRVRYVVYACLIAPLCTVLAAWIPALWSHLPPAAASDLVPVTADEAAWLRARESHRPGLTEAIDKMHVYVQGGVGITRHNFEPKEEIVLLGGIPLLGHLFQSTSPPPWVAHVSCGWPWRAFRGEQFYDGAEPAATTRFAVAPVTAFLGSQPDRLIPLAPVWPGLGANTLFFAVVLFAAFVTPRLVIARTRHARGRCPACGHTLASALCCPECGH